MNFDLLWTARVAVVLLLAGAGTGTRAAPHGPRYVPADFFGTTTHVNGPWALPLLRELNMHVVRLDFTHQALEPSVGTYAFGDDHWIISSADFGVTNGLDQLAVVTTYNTYPRIADDPGAFEDFAFAIAAKYKGAIRYWQASNEPDLTKPVVAEQYPIMLKAFYRGVKRADPENQVVLAGLAGEEPRLLDMLYQRGAKDFCDILASHSYTRPRLPEEGGFLQRIASLHEVMKKHGDEKPLWVTEIGWNGVEPSMLDYLRSNYPSHRAYSSTEEIQARALARVYLLAATDPWIERVYFFNLAQRAAYTDVHPETDSYIGIVSEWPAGRHRPKDAYFAVKTVIAMIGESTYLGRIDLGARVWALMFEREEAATVALWSLDDGIALQLDDTAMITGVTSMVGTPVEVRNDTLLLSGRPVYAQCDARDLDALRQRIADAAVQGQENVQVSMALDRPGTLAAGRPVLALEVANISREEVVPGPIELQVAEPWRAAVQRIRFDVPLAPGQVEQRTWQVEGPDMRPGEFRMHAVARPERGMRSETTLCYASFVRRSFAFVADGRLDEWASRRPVELGKVAAEREIAAWRGPEDCSARWHVAWDDDALFVAAEVRDDVHHQASDRDTSSGQWMGDGIQLALDMGDDARPASNLPAYDGRNDVELGLALSPDGPIVHVWAHPHHAPGAADLADVAVIRDEDASVTRYEAAIPWRTLGWTGLVANQWMGMNLVVNDNDGADRRGALQWSDGMVYGKDPSRFPKVLLAEGR